MANIQQVNASDQLQSVHAYFQAKKASLVPILGNDMEAERVFMAALMVVSENPALRKCSPQSIYKSCVKAALAGFDLAAMDGSAYLVPYKGECSLQIGYLGYQREAALCGFLVDAGVVYENDVWDYCKVPLHIEHRPVIGEDKRGDPIAVYAVAYQLGRLVAADVSSMEDVDKAKRMSRSPAWKDWPERMARKFAIKRLCKGLPLGRKGQYMRALDAEAEGGPTVPIQSVAEIVEAGPRVIEGQADWGEDGAKLIGNEMPNPDFQDDGPPPQDFDDVGPEPWQEGE